MGRTLMQRFRNRDWKCRKRRRLGRAATLGRFLGTFSCLDRRCGGAFRSLGTLKRKALPFSLVRVQEKAVEERSFLRGNAL